MKIEFKDNHKYGVYLYGDDHSWDAGTAFENFDDALDFCEKQIDIYQQAYSAEVYDLDTRTIVAECSWEDEDEYFNDDVDESNYDPYLGCEVYETEPFCDMW